uniref:disease resistance protein RPP2B-like n=1 Tax=Erigeron canadensis TaxID=72917 RepID=UPI001CB91027|nr:disease resistance protein RPP2B-like [Erigeron canadensis]
MKFLDDSEGIKLFSLYAFRQTYPTHDFNDLAYQLVKYLQGHPLALKVIGSALFEKPAHIWRSELETLQMSLNSEIQQKLRPTFDLLDFDQKRIFLDIACSLIGENIDLSASVLSINCSAVANIDVLVNKSLIAISPYDFSIHMHELIRNMAREVQRREESDRPVRLWSPSEVYALLGENKVTKITKAVEVLVLLLQNPVKSVEINCKAFSKMKKLRILKICHPGPKIFEQSFQLSMLTDSRVNFSGSLDFLSNELRLIYWHGYPFKSFPSNFHPENVVAIDLSFSNIISFWTTPKCFRRLKVMNLRHCRNLATTPDFTEMVNLEKLILEGCVSLVKLHPSIGMHRKLVMLNLRDCIHIRSFPSKVEMDSLQVLILSGCLNLDNLNQVSGNLKSLEKLYADGTAITGFPSFISSLTNLQVLEIGTQMESSTLWTSIFQKQPQSLVLPSLESFPFLAKLKVINRNISQVRHDSGALLCLRHVSLKKCKTVFDFLEHFLEQHQYLGTLLLSTSQHIFSKTLPRLIHRQHNLHCYFTGCPCVHKPTSHASTNQLSIWIKYLGIQSRIRKFFRVSESRSSSRISGNRTPRSFTKTNNILEIIFYGNIIPRWFTNKSKGTNLKVELPPNWCYSKFKGYAFCVVFTLKESCIGPPGVSVNNFDGASLVEFRATLLESILIYDTDMMIWLCIMIPGFGWNKAKNFVTFSFGDNNEDVEVKECGVRLVCDDDEDFPEEKETILSMIQHLPPQTQPTGGYFRFSDNFGYTSFSW